MILLNEISGLYRKYQIRSRIEPKNAEMKRYHGLDRANGYGLQSVRSQAMFTAIAVNLKRMAVIEQLKKAG